MTVVFSNYAVNVHKTLLMQLEEKKAFLLDNTTQRCVIILFQSANTVRSLSLSLFPEEFHDGNYLYHPLLQRIDTL